MSTELSLHAEILEWLRYTLPAGAITHHSPNEGRRGWKAQAALKKTGVRKGWPDLEIFYDYDALFIEVKPKGKYANKEQKALHAELRAQGFPVEICHSIDEVKAAILQHYPEWLGQADVEKSYGGCA